ncbi:MAG: serine protease [Planctomycetota bacterium]
MSVLKKRIVVGVLWAIYTLAVAAYEARAGDAAPPPIGRTAPVQRLATPVEEPWPADWRDPPVASWRWTPAAPHHAAAVRLRCPNGSTGAGVYVELRRGTRGVLTCLHVVEGSTRVAVRWIDGRVSVGTRAATDRYGADLAFVTLRKGRDDVRPLPVTDRLPKPGEWLEAMGYGSGRTRLRHYYVRHRGASGLGQGGREMARGDAMPMQGDSGGALVTLDSQGRHAVCSVVTNGDGAAYRGAHDSTYFAAMLYPDPSRAVAFADRVDAKLQCGPRGCFPERSGPGPPPGGADIYPPGDPYRIGPGQSPQQPQPQRPPFQRPAPYAPTPPGGRTLSTGEGVALVGVVAAIVGALCFRNRLD